MSSESCIIQEVGRIVAKKVKSTSIRKIVSFYLRKYKFKKFIEVYILPITRRQYNNDVRTATHRKHHPELQTIGGFFAKDNKYFITIPVKHINKYEVIGILRHEIQHIIDYEHHYRHPQRVFRGHHRDYADFELEYITNSQLEALILR